MTGCFRSICSAAAGRRVGLGKDRKTAASRLTPQTLFLALLLSSPILHAQSSILNPELGERSITIRQITPGGRVVVFGVAREPLNTTPRTPAVVVRAEILTDADGDGIVQWTLNTAVPRLGMWAVVDLSSGAHAAFVTPGFERTPMALLPEVLQNDNGGQLRKLQWPYSELDLLVVRPGEGAWRHYASKDSEADENKAESGKRALKMDVAGMIRIADSPAPPDRFRKGDIVAMFDRRGMRFGILEVGK